MNDLETPNKALFQESISTLKHEMRAEMSNILTATLAAHLAKQRNPSVSGHNVAKAAEPAHTTTGQSTTKVVEPAPSAQHPGTIQNTPNVELNPGNNGANSIPIQTEPKGKTPIKEKPRIKRSRNQEDDDTVSIATGDVDDLERGSHRKRHRASTRSRSRS